MATYPALDVALTQASARLDGARQNLYYCDVVALGKGTSRQLRHDIQAATYVYVAAACEAYLNQVLAATVIEINAANVQLQDLRLSLFAVTHGSYLSSLQDIRGLKMWARRADLFKDLGSQVSAHLDVAHLPLDGGTIRPTHLDTVWHVFGLPGASAPSPIHRLALSDVADNRNSVAHGQADAAQIAGQKSLPDMLRLLERVEECILHIHYKVGDYLSSKTYLRSGGESR